MRRFVVGTAGHVDHGKTTLVRALTGVDTDRLPEEKKRGITIELGFAPWVIDEETFACMIDVPGHKRLVHTMIAGASGMEVVLLVVAADEGVMPQTREHLAACEILGIRTVVVALTKCDRVDPELALLAADEVSEELSGRFEHEVVRCSARTGEGLDAVRDAMRRALSKRRAPSEPHHAGATLGIDRVFSVRGVGSVVTGTLVSGKFATGDSVFVIRGDGARATTIRGMHVFDRAVDEASAPTRLALNLASISTDELSRGDVISSEPLIPTRCLDAALTLTRPLRSGATVEVYVGTARSLARVRYFPAPNRDTDPAVDVPSPSLLARFVLAEPLVVLGDQRFVVRTSLARGPSGAVIGGGVTLDTHPPARVRSKAKRASVLTALEAKNTTDAALSLVREVAPKALFGTDLAQRFSMPRAQLLRVLEKLVEKGEVVRIKPEGYAERSELVALATRASELVSAHHASRPLDRGLLLETLRQKLAARAGIGVAEEAIRFGTRAKVDPLSVQGDVVRLASFREGHGAELSPPLVKTIDLLAQNGLKGSGEHAIVESLGCQVKEARALLAKLVRDGHVIALGGQWFHRPAVDALRSTVVDHLRSHPVLTIADFKTMSGLGRKQAIPLLELFDREGVSMRQGDDRTPGPLSRPR